jgi:hypothetical protein
LLTVASQTFGHVPVIAALSKSVETPAQTIKQPEARAAVATPEPAPASQPPVAQPVKPPEPPPQAVTAEPVKPDTKPKKNKPDVIITF